VQRRFPNLPRALTFGLVTAEGQNAVIGLAFDPDERPSAPDALVDIVMRVLALVPTVNMHELDAMLGPQVESEGAIQALHDFKKM
jgi:hypothetical protein